jgi:autotransporter-associated beta strand protein
MPISINLNGTTGGAVIDQSGTGLLKFSSACTATGVGLKTFTLQGSTAGTGEIAGVIVDGSGTTAISKTGNGTWTLSGANTYTGLTTISTGIVKLGSTTALGSAAAGTVISDGTALDLNGIAYANAEAITLNGTGVSSSGAIYNSSATAASFPGAISLASASTVTADYQITLSGTISNNQHFTKAGNGSLIFTNNTITVNNVVLLAGTIAAGTSTINIYGSFTNSGTFTANTGTVNLLGSSSQAIPSVSFYNFSISNAAGATIEGDVSVTGTLTLTTGNIAVGTNTLTAATISGGSASSYIITNTAYNASPAGYLKIPSVNGAIRTFPVGTAASYTPCFITNSGTAQDFKVRVFTGVYANGLSGSANPDMAKLVNRTWEITPTVQTGINAIITLQWNAADEGATFTTNHSYAVVSKNRHIVGNNGWVPQTSTVLTGSDPYSISTASGISTFSTFGVSGSSLPIELKTFKAHKSGTTATISWTTASETNNNFFTLERASDGQNWHELYRCDGAGTSTFEHIYSYIDTNPLSGINYYRLKQTDVDGMFSYSSIESLRFNSDSISLLIYPMPAKSDEMNLFLRSFKTGTVVISISDMSGKQMCKGEIEVSTSPLIIPLSDICSFVAGSYIVTISNKELVVTKKIVIE